MDSDADPGDPEHTDPGADPDPQHWQVVLRSRRGLYIFCYYPTKALKKNFNV